MRGSRVSQRSGLEDWTADSISRRSDGSMCCCSRWCTTGNRGRQLASLSPSLLSPCVRSSLFPASFLLSPRVYMCAGVLGDDCIMLGISGTACSFASLFLPLSPLDSLHHATARQAASRDLRSSVGIEGRRPGNSERQRIAEAVAVRLSRNC